MRTFKPFLKFEFKRSFTRLNVVVLILYLLAAMFVVHRGVDKYKDLEEKKEKFQKNERLKVEIWNNYTQYGGYGIRLYFMPSPLSVFFNNTNLFTEATAQIDVSEKLNIYQSFKGKEVFMQGPGRYLDFSGIILMFGSFLALFYGYDTLKHKEFLKFLARIYGGRKVYSAMYSSRLVLLLSYFIFIFIAALVWASLRGIDIFSDFSNVGKPLIIFFVLIISIIAFFFAVGTVIGGIRNRFRGILVILAWLFSIYLFPVGINTFVEIKTGNISSNYDIELDKLTKLMNFEDEAAIKLQFLGKTFKKIGKKEKGGKGDKGGIASVQTLRIYLKEQEEEKRRGLYFIRLLKYMQNQPFAEVLETVIPIEKDIIKDFKEVIDREFGNNIKGDSDIRPYVNLLRYKIVEKMMMDFQKKVFPKILEMDGDLKKQMSSIARLRQNIYYFFPSTFYLAVNNEISSRGFRNILDFYEEAREIKEKFFSFYAPKKVLENMGKKEKIVSFFKDNKDFSNVFEGKSHLPAYFWVGILCTLLWLYIACRLSSLFYKRSIFYYPREEVIGTEDLEIEFNQGEAHVVLTNKKITLSSHLYNVLSGKDKRFKGKVSTKEGNLTLGKRGVDFVYFCQPDQIPGEITIRNFTSLMAGGLSLKPDQREELNSKLNLKKLGKQNFGELDLKERAKIILEVTLLKKSDIYMFHDFAKGFSTDFIKDFVDRLKGLKDHGSSILYITNDGFLGQKIGDYVSVSREDAALITTIF